MQNRKDKISLTEAKLMVSSLSSEIEQVILSISSKVEMDEEFRYSRVLLANKVSDFMRLLKAIEAHHIQSVNTSKL